MFWYPFSTSPWLLVIEPFIVCWIGHPILFIFSHFWMDSTRFKFWKDNIWNILSILFFSYPIAQMNDQTLRYDHFKLRVIFLSLLSYSLTLQNWSAKPWNTKGSCFPTLEFSHEKNKNKLRNKEIKFPLTSPFSCTKIQNQASKCCDSLFSFHMGILGTEQVVFHSLLSFWFPIAETKWSCSLTLAFSPSNFQNQESNFLPTSSN